MKRNADYTRWMPEPRDPDDAFPMTSLHVRQALAGEAESLDWIVLRFTPLLLAQARYRLRGRMASICDPEDVVNDVWLAALPKLHRVEPRAGRFTPVLLSYLSSFVLNRVNTLVMKHLRDKPSSTPSIPSALPAQTLGAITRAVSAERRDAVLTAIEELDELDREVLVLRGIEQRPGPEVAERLDVSPGALRVRYHRALKRLRDRLPGGVFDELDDEPPAPGD
ncbi:MAG: DNA-directed RNA polymerase sigma-70 factor [Planctomycetota bacterium]|nr:MAG: DNA-directed RNA polymerase sigma-70 factor [Planctomycetota bacterium]